MSPKNTSHHQPHTIDKPLTRGNRFFLLPRSSFLFFSFLASPLHLPLPLPSPPMADIQYSYSISELERGNDVVFTDSGASTLVDSQPEVNERYRRLPLVEVVVDSISEVADASTNTTHCALVAQGMSHCTGGWPLSVDPTEAESQWKYTEKIEREESFIGAMTVLGPGVVKLLRENNTLDLYEKYLFADSLHETYYQSSDVPSLKLSNVLSGTGEVTGSSWSPFNSFRLAVAHTGNTLLPGMVWDINETQKPIARLLPNKESLTAIAYSVKDLNIVAGGSADGMTHTPSPLPPPHHDQPPQEYSTAGTPGKVRAVRTTLQ